MIYLYKTLFLLSIVLQIIVTGTKHYREIIIVLMLTASNIYREKFNNSIILIIAESVLILIGAKTNNQFLMLLGYIVFDLSYKGMYRWTILAILAGVYFINKESVISFLLISGISGILGLVVERLEHREDEFKTALDDERRYRYELERTKLQLLNQSRDIAHIAEIKERNRIARQIHDSIGHSISGILMQLQAAVMIHDKDEAKSMELLKDSIDKLSNSLTVLRDTVHNIMPRENLGIEYIKEIIDNFHFCSVDFKHSGDFNLVPANIMEIITANIKEALTNVSKHSNAENVCIVIDINERYVGLLIKDDGTSMNMGKEGLGLSGMRERAQNAGGNISISFGPEEGFLIVCVTPLNMEGRGLFEGSNSGR